MPIAKAISLFGSLVYLLIFVGGLFLPNQIKEFVSHSSQVNSKTIIALTISFSFLLFVINLCYFYYLYVSSKNGEEISSAAFLSLQLVILPIMLLAGVLIIFAF